MIRTVQLVRTGSEICLPFDFCIQCGIEKDATLRVFEQTDDNPIAHFAKLAGEVSILAEFVLNKSHVIKAPFCSKCFRRFNGVPKKRQLFFLASLIVIFITVIVALAISSLVSFEASLLTFGLGILSAIAVRIWGRVYAWKNSPDIRRVTSEKITLKVPGKGKFVCRV